eukprot:541067-Rhodomonas_salina.2
MYGWLHDLVHHPNLLGSLPVRRDRRTLPEHATLPELLTCVCKGVPHLQISVRAVCVVFVPAPVPAPAIVSRFVSASARRKCETCFWCRGAQPEKECCGTRSGWVWDFGFTWYEHMSALRCN